MKAQTHKLVAEVVSWSMKLALDGAFPSVGFRGEELVGQRLALKGKVLAHGWCFAYFGFKADAKARKESHFFERSYQHSLICEGCLAEKPNKHGDPAMLFKNFFDGAPHTMTELSHDDYVRTSTTPTPWLGMPGFNVKTAFRDPMHTIYLGTAKELLASCMGYWSRKGCLPGENLQEQLQILSRRQRVECMAAGLKGNFKAFTPANTGLDTASEYPELGSAFKAATMKLSIWFFAKYAAELAHGLEEILGFMSSSCSKTLDVSVSGQLRPPKEHAWRCPGILRSRGSSVPPRSMRGGALVHLGRGVAPTPSRSMRGGDLECVSNSDFCVQFCEKEIQKTRRISC